jgi:endonuclease-3
VALIANTPVQYRKDAHHWLLLHGRYVCTARAPACPACLIRDLCEYPHKTQAKAARARGKTLAQAIRRRGSTRRRA